MKHVNEIKVVGNIGSVESRETMNGNTVLKISIVTELTQQRLDGTPFQETTWFNIEQWIDNPKEAEQFTKGQTLEVVGTFRTRSFKGMDGKKVYYSYIQPSAPLKAQSLTQPKAKGKGA